MTRTAIMGLCALLLASGCSWFEDPTPNEARLVIDGETGKPVRLIISTKFVAAINEVGETRVEIFEADTLVTSLPYDNVYRIERDQRFFVEAARLETDLQNVRMQVYVDDRRQFDQGGVLLEGQPYRFVYAFNQAIVRDIQVL